MKNLRKSWMLIGLSAFGAIVCLFNVGWSSARPPADPPKVAIYTPSVATGANKHILNKSANLGNATAKVGITAVDSAGNPLSSTPATITVLPGATTGAPPSSPAATHEVTKDVIRTTSGVDMEDVCAAEGGSARP